MTICLVTDRRQLSPDARTEAEEVVSLIDWLDEAIGAGIDLIQVRERDLAGRRLADLARNVGANAKGSRTRVVVNDRADIALACGCDGVHVRGDGPPEERIRDLVARSGFDDRELLIGRSVHSSDEARAHASADYLMCGAVFDSGPKRGAGLGALRATVEAVRAAMPNAPPSVIAIGGITPARAAECLAAGASGVAAIRLFLPRERGEGALGVLEAARQLREVFDAAATGHLQ